MLTQRQQTPATVRNGFTLIELLIVISIILILLALIIPGVGAVMSTVRNTQVQTEIADLKTKVSDFQASFSLSADQNFPSRIVLFETGADWDTPNADANIEFLRKQTLSYFNALWPNVNLNANRDFNDNGTPGETLTLTGAECLVFFLGGMPDSDGNDGNAPFTMLGFSKNPSNPFARSGTNRVGPFMEFPGNRLVDLDGDGMPEYLDSLPGQSAPFLYLSGNYGRGYVAADAVVGSSDDLDGAYQQKGGTFYHAKGFQIISPGVDGEYGVGGIYDDSTQLNGPRSVESDNITSFSDGVLGG